MPISRDDVVSCATQMLRDEGLEALSLRKIAASLGVTAPTLYWHIGSKRELMDLVAEQLMRERMPSLDSRPAAGQHWTQWLRERSVAMFEALAHTKDAPRVMAGNRPSVAAMPMINEQLEALVAVGFTPACAQQSLLALGSYVLGSALEWQSEQARFEAGVVDSALQAEVERAVVEGHYATMIEAVQATMTQPYDATFKQGLDLFIDGMAAQLAHD